MGTDGDIIVFTDFVDGLVGDVGNEIDLGIPGEKSGTI
jgi:hypothetical protein